jgi:hypothetical protein
MHVIDELGHETALPSLLGTNRAGLGELGVDLATAARQGKSSWGLSFPLTIEFCRDGFARAPGKTRPGCALTTAVAANPSETMIKTAARSPANSYQFLTNSGRRSRLNPGAFLGDQ